MNADNNDNNIDKWTDLEWHSLIHSIENQQCILLLGPNAAVPEDSDQEFLRQKFIQVNSIRSKYEGQLNSLSSLLAAGLSQNFASKKEYKDIDLTNLTQAASYNLFEGQSKKGGLRAEAARFYAATRERNCTSKLHRTLAKLPFKIIITSTPDEMMYQGFTHVDNKTPQIDRYNYNGKNPKAAKAWSVDKPLIYYLCGTMNEWGSLVLTEDDLLSYVVKIAQNIPPLPDNLLNYLRSPDKSLLFIGFGLRHWYLRILIHVLRGPSEEIDSFALEQVTPKNVDSYRRAILFFKKSAFNLHICGIDKNEFVNELMRRCHPDSTNSNVLENKRFSIFICAVSEDEERVIPIRDQLESHDIKAWFYRKDQRTGANWEKEIENKIKKVNYFILIQSLHLQNREESDSYRELGLALKRSERFGQERRFIFPVSIDQIKNLPQVEHLHACDLTNYSNIDKLIEDLNDDWNKRNHKK